MKSILIAVAVACCSVSFADASHHRRESYVCKNGECRRVVAPRARSVVRFVLPPWRR